jgi:large subunit ribosomal protein L24
MQETKRVKNPRKQRKRLFNAPAHIRHKLMAAPLSNELAVSRGAKTLPVRKGDTVRIMRGDNKGFEGKVSRIDLKNYRVYIEGLTREKVDGTNIFVSVHPSKVMLRNLSLDDNWRKEILARKEKVEKPKKETKVKGKEAKKSERLQKVKEKPEGTFEEEKVEKSSVDEKVVPKMAKEKIAEKAPVAKKAAAKKPAAKKLVEKEKTVVSAKKAKPAKKAAKQKVGVKKTALKPGAKRKTSKKTKGGQ